MSYNRNGTPHIRVCLQAVHKGRIRFCDGPGGVRRVGQDQAEERLFPSVVAVNMSCRCGRTIVMSQ